MSKILARWIEPGIAGTTKGISQNGSTYALEVKVDSSTISFDGGGNVQIPANGVTATQLASDSVTTVKILNANVTGAKIASATITSGNIASATITGGNIASATITGSNIAATTITPSNIDQTQAVNLSNTANVIKVATPVAATDAANKGYVDGVAFGVDWKQAVRLTTAAPLGTNTYANGASGVGATLTENDAFASGPLTVDGIPASVNDRVLVQSEVTQTHNGIYIVTAIGNGTSTNWVLTRASDSNTPAEVEAGTAVFTQEGTINQDMGFVQITPNPITIGTSNLVYTEFTGLGQITPGAGLTKTANTISVALTTNKGLTFSGGTTGTLEVKVDNSTLDFTGGGAIEVKTNGITATQLLKSDTYDFATAGGTVRVTTQSFGNSSTLAASTAFVQAAVSGAGILNVEYLTLSGTDITNKYIDLAHAPQNGTFTLVDVIGGGAQIYTVDFTVIAGGSGNNRLNWNGLGMDTVLISGSILRVVYYY